MVMMVILPQYPLILAVFVAFCGVALIVYGIVWPSGHPGLEQRRLSREGIRQTALTELWRTGVSGNISVVNFGDGLGLAVTASVEKGSVLLTVPEELSLSMDRPRSCVRPEDMTSGMWTSGMWPGWAIGASLRCKVERMLVRAVARKEASRLTGLLSLLVMERRAAQEEGEATAAAQIVLEVLPDVGWQSENGLFAMDPEELRVLGAGTSLESWRAIATNETAQAHTFMRQEIEKLTGEEIGLDEVQWAYMMLQSYGHWPEGGQALAAATEGLELPGQVLFLWPLLLARPTPDANYAVIVRHDKAHQRYELLASRDMAVGDEVLFSDPRLGDASALCFRGLWLTARHRARLRLNVLPADRRDPKSQLILAKYGCGTVPLSLFVTAERTVDPLFLSCMRMLALAGNATRLQLAEQRGWTEDWPETDPFDQRTETAAAEIAVEALQQALERLSSSSAEARQRFGSDTLVARPVMRVREAETMMVVSLLKSMRELALLSSHEYLFEALRDSQKELHRKAREQARPASTS